MAASWNVSFATRSGRRLDFEMDAKPVGSKVSVVLLKVREPAEYDLESWREVLRKEKYHCFKLDLAVPVVSGVGDSGVGWSASTQRNPQGVEGALGGESVTDKESGPISPPTDGLDEVVQKNAVSDIRDFMTRAAGSMGSGEVILLAGGSATKIAVSYMRQQIESEKSTKKDTDVIYGPGAKRVSALNAFSGPGGGAAEKNNHVDEMSGSSGGDENNEHYALDDVISRFTTASRKRFSRVAVCGLAGDYGSDVKESLGSRILVGPEEPVGERMLHWIHNDFTKWVDSDS